MPACARLSKVLTKLLTNAHHTGKTCVMHRVYVDAIQTSSYSAHLQVAKLTDDLAAKEAETQRLQASEGSMRADLQKQMALFTNFERKLAAQEAEAAQQIEDLRLQLTAAQLTAPSLRASVNAAKASGTAAPPGASAPAAADNVYIEGLERQLTDAEGKIEMLTAEQEQLHDMYQQLEADVGRSIDEATAQERGRISELNLQIEVLHPSASIHDSRSQCTETTMKACDHAIRTCDHVI